MTFLKSLKYQIAFAMFMVQLTVVSLLLWNTQSSTFEEAKNLIKDKDHSVLLLLSSVSEESLFNQDYFGIQPFYVQATESSHILKAFLMDEHGDVVVSSDSKLLGQKNPEQAVTNESYWLRSTFESNDEEIGEIVIQFSQKEIQTSYESALRQGLFLGSLGILVTGILSVLMGSLLTRRLGYLKENTERFANGDLEVRFELKGQDELSSLGSSLNIMADQIKSNLKEIEHLAFHDELTGLANRREFNRRLELAFNSAKNHGQFYVLLFLDLDKFKLVNDACGHHAGDQLLIQISDVMMKVLRNRDTLVRFGGDEFGVLLENCSLAQAEEVANKLLVAVDNFRFSWDDKIMQVGVSIGGMALNAETNDIEQLLSSADAACYTAKEKGRNQVHMVYPGDSVIEGHFTEVDWINRLSTMLNEDLFKVAFQKICSVENPLDVKRVEFLLRMQDEHDRWVSPAIFIDAAERFDSIQRLDRYVIDKVFGLIAADKVPVKDAICFINLSGKSIGEKGLFTYVQSKLIEYGLNAKRVCFEITETAAIANFNHASVFIEKARQLGCSFALDDFGSGMCSFSYLKNLQVDYVKIDGSFILSMSENAVDKTIVKSVNKISHRSGFKTIAEFVENEDIFNQVKELKIDFAQGYGLHKPEVIN